MYRKSYNRKLCTESLTTGSYVQEVLQQETMYRKSYNRKLCSGSLTTGRYVQELEMLIMDSLTKSHKTTTCYK